ncbi:MAG: CrcB family protein [Alistipes sp.]|nr:CrcB family protein [Alistipes sp.]
MQNLVRDILLVGTGGFLGSTCRFLVSLAFSGVSSTAGFPLATFTVNALGSLIMGAVMPLAGAGPLHLLLAVGFCGGFTTFSAFSAETLGLLRSGHVWAGLAYAAASILVCVLFVGIGIYAGSKLKGI